MSRRRTETVLYGWPMARPFLVAAPELVCRQHFLRELARGEPGSDLAVKLFQLCLYYGPSNGLVCRLELPNPARQFQTDSHEMVIYVH